MGGKQGTFFFISNPLFQKIPLSYGFRTKIHTGNGTQTAFYDDKSVMYMSLHRYENGTFYPPGEDGGPHDCGEGDAEGTYVFIGPPSSSAFTLYSRYKLTICQKK